MKIGLGTVQFGQDYGISNLRGQTPPEEVSRILETANAHGVTVLDTAALYGHSETVLGRCLPKKHNFHIVTKSSKCKGAIVTDEDVTTLETTFSNSLSLLGQSSVYGFMVHDAEDLLKEGGGRLFAKMEEFKALGLVQKIGASVYTGSQIELLRSRYRLDLLQAPLNILDQRLLRGGHLKALKDDGTEIHIRSAFLQGLLLMPPTEVPIRLLAAQQPLESLRGYVTANGLTALEAALGFVAGLPEADAIVCGVNSRSQLVELLAAYRPLDLDFSAFAITDQKIIDPSTWNKSAAEPDRLRCAS